MASTIQLPELKYIQDVNESKALNDIRGPFIVISASGMCEAGRILHHLKNNIENPRNTILITGFQAENTLGRKIVERQREVPIFGDPMRLRAEVVTLNELSGHADQRELLLWIKRAAPGLKKIFLVHGEPLQQQALAEQSSSSTISLWLSPLAETPSLCERVHSNAPERVPLPFTAEKSAALDGDIACSALAYIALYRRSHLEDAVRVASDLQRSGILTSLDYLGENVQPLQRRRPRLATPISQRFELCTPARNCIDEGNGFGSGCIRRALPCQHGCACAVGVGNGQPRRDGHGGLILYGPQSKDRA